MAFKRAKLEQKEAVRFGLDRESLSIGLPFFPEEAWNDADKIKVYGFRIVTKHAVRFDRKEEFGLDCELTKAQ